ncbi:LPP20 family lipoprotein [Idiomarina xiamenensis]|uniref:Lipoprotein LPP20-like domain-containing protein n=1 Tax=Idiomarina xiamenensis 10-D-4 TaxID=740709 RepID=K2K645_9GAMM|nr:LPP20 family lipoprotein [Idiomarina xiamenensis]EKE82067.1 hypothetical protein A10D4_09829 [Idiomarina xiamenensis 10-D-4]
MSKSRFFNHSVGKCVSSLLLAFSLSACSVVYDQQYVEWETVKPKQFPVLSAVGYAPIAKQPGASNEEQMLAAMRASKLAAYRELAEQVYGQRISGNSAVADWALQSDSYQTSVDGVIRGAEVVRTYSAGEFYATELRLDFERVHNLYQSINRPQRVKNVVYY